MKQPLRVVIIGAGSAGEEHTKALCYAGVEVVAICARQSAAVQQVADRLFLAQASTDWRQRLETACPDIVALATPAVLRSQVVEMAADLGCHLLVEKPLATTGQPSQSHLPVSASGRSSTRLGRHPLLQSGLCVTERINSAGNDWTVTRNCGDHGHSTPAIMLWSWMSSLAAGGGPLVPTGHPGSYQRRSTGANYEPEPSVN